MRKLLLTIAFFIIPLAQAEATTYSLILRVAGTWGDTFNSNFLVWESTGDSSGTLYINGTAIGGAAGFAHRFFQQTDTTYIEQDLTSRSLRFKIAGTTIATLTQSGSFVYVGDYILKPFAAPSATGYISWDSTNSAFIFAVYNGSGFVKVASMSATEFQISAIELDYFPVFALGFPTKFFEMDSITDAGVENGKISMWEVTASGKTALE